jgi:hypothetical protein
MTRQATDPLSRERRRLEASKRAQRQRRVEAKPDLAGTAALTLGIDKLRWEALRATQKGYLGAEERKALAALVAALAALLHEEVVL